MADQVSSPLAKATRRTVLAASCLVGLDAALAQQPLLPIAPGVPRPMPMQGQVPGKKYPPRAYMFIDDVISPALFYKVEMNVSDALLNGVTSIVLVVSSGGGSIDAAVGIHNVFASIAPQVTAYNISAVDSAANVIFQAASKRVSHPNAHFIFHPIANLQQINGINAAIAHDYGDSLEESARQVADVLRSRSKIDAAQLAEMFRKQVIVGAKEALSLGLVDEIAELKFPLGQIMIPG